MLRNGETKDFHANLLKKYEEQEEVVAVSCATNERRPTI